MKFLTWLFTFLVIVYLKNGETIEFPTGTSVYAKGATRSIGNGNGGHIKICSCERAGWPEIIAIFPLENILYAEVKLPASVPRKETLKTEERKLIGR